MRSHSTNVVSVKAFSTENQSVKLQGELRRKRKRLHFKSDSVRLAADISQVDIKRSSGDRELVFLSGGGFGEFVLYGASEDLLLLLESVEPTESQEPIRRVGADSGPSWWWVGLLTLVFAALGVVYFLDYAQERLVSAAVNVIPKEAEVVYGRAMYQVFVASGATVEDERVQRQLQVFARPLLSVAEHYGFPFHVAVIRDDTINAFALPGGFIGLHTGLIERAPSANAVLGVLAHEIGHVTNRHRLRKLFSTLGVRALMSRVFREEADSFGVLMEQVPGLLSQKFSRDHEREADMLAVQYLHEAGIDPSGLISFMNMLTTEYRERQGLAVLFETHPPTSERLETVSSMIGSLEPKQYMNLEPAFRRLRGQLSRRPRR